MLLFNMARYFISISFIRFKYILCYCSTTVKSTFLKIKNIIKALIIQCFIENLPGDLVFCKNIFKRLYKSFQINVLQHIVYYNHLGKLRDGSWKMKFWRAVPFYKLKAPILRELSKYYSNNKPLLSFYYHFLYLHRFHLLDLLNL